MTPPLPYHGRWLHRKKQQAKEEEVRRAHYKKLYFSQPRKLKEHTMGRYVIG